MIKKLQNAQVEELYQAILQLENLEDCANFFEDLCTVSELKAIAQRWEVARMLDEGTVYSRIAEKTGASTATISRVNRALQYGTEGYQKALEKWKK